MTSSLEAVYKKPITLQFKDATLKQIFEIISQSSGLNFIFDKDVKTDQKTSIFLKDSSIEAAVYYTLMTNQLDQQVMDSNTILIYPNSVAKQKDYQEMLVKSFFLNNADAKTVAEHRRARQQDGRSGAGGAHPVADIVRRRQGVGHDQLARGGLQKTDHAAI